jgi:hypothetical protein
MDAWEEREAPRTDEERPADERIIERRGARGEG